MNYKKLKKLLDKRFKLATVIDNYPENWYSPQRMLHQAMNYKKLLDKQSKLDIELDDYKDNWMEGKQRSS